MNEPTATIKNQDCIVGMADMTENSVDLTVTSIPFEELFTYSGKVEDVGNNGSTLNLREGRFALNLRFWIEQVFRVTKPGRNCCIHIQQLLAYKNQHGFIGRRDFRGALVDLMSKHGWQWKGEFVIAKDPQVMAQRLNLHSLMFVTGKRDATGLVSAPNDYVVIFQKPGENPAAVPALYDPTENPKGWLSCEDWIRDACGVWGDIDAFDILDGARNAKESDEEKHVCPLQLEVIRRCVRLYSNPGELVMDPFMGIGSVAYVAIEQGRNAVGFELKDSYYTQALRHIERIKASKRDGLGELFAKEKA